MTATGRVGHVRQLVGQDYDHRLARSGGRTGGRGGGERALGGGRQRSEHQGGDGHCGHPQAGPHC